MLWLYCISCTYRKNKEKINKTKKRKEKEKASHILKTTYHAKKVDHEFNKIANMA